MFSPRAGARLSGLRSSRLGRVQLGVRIVGVLAVAYVGLALIVANPRCLEPRPADAIVVLGAAVWPGERPSPALQRRIDRGVALWQAGAAPLLVPSGGLGRYPPSEAEVMARVADRAGVPADALVLESRATSTLTSALEVARLAAERGWRSVIVVSEPYHVLRAGWTFRDRGLEVQVACAARGPELSWRVYQTMREVGGLLAYGLLGAE